MVKRYSMDFHGSHGEDAFMAKCDDGEYVLHSDYATLEAENNQLRRQILDAWNAFGPPAERSDTPVFTFSDIADLPQSAEGGIAEQIFTLEDHIAALEVQLAEKVKVKPLEWVGFTAGSYHIEIEKGGIASLLYYSASIAEDEEPELIKTGYLTLVSLDDLKAIAQADHERRTIDALENISPALKVKEFVKFEGEQDTSDSNASTLTPLTSEHCSDTHLKPYAFEFGRLNGDSTYSVFIERSLPPKTYADWPVKPLYLNPSPNKELERENTQLRKERAEVSESRLDEVMQALDEAASALIHAREGLIHWGYYVGEYFQKKHDFAGDVDRIAKQANAARIAYDGGKSDG